MTLRSISLTALLVLGIALCSAQTLRAADAAVGTGTIKGKVMGPGGKPANGVTVRLVAGESAKAKKGGKKGKAAAEAAAQPAQAQALAAKGDKAAAKAAKRAPALKETTTSDQGEFTFTDVPAGNYSVVAGGKGIGNGHAAAAVTAGNSVSLSLTLKAPKDKDKAPKAAGKAPRPEPGAPEPAAPAK